MIEFFIAFVLPYVAFVIFVIGTIYRIYEWSKCAVPLKIPTTCAQQKSLKNLRRTIWDRIDCPSNKLETFVRMLFEVFLFRSLFRNTKYYIEKQKQNDTRWLWLFAIMFHYCLLIILIRHLRFFTNPVPGFVQFLDFLDSAMGEAFVPPVYMTSLIALAALAFLWGRRIFLAKERSISIPSDHLILGLMAGILISGITMRYFIKVDVAAVKEVALGLVTFHPPSADVLHSIGWIFYVHLFLVCITIAYLPFSKVMHFAGVWFSPTRNMPNNNRYERHINPWDPNPEVPILVREGRAVKLDWNKYYEMYKDQLDEIAEKGYVLKPEEL